MLNIEYDDVIKLLESYKRKLSESLESTTDYNYCALACYRITLLDVAINVVTQYADALNTLDNKEE